MIDASIGVIPANEYAYWSAGIAPSPLIKQRLPSRQRLLAFLEAKSVSLRGWNYPHIPKNEPPEGVSWLPDGGIEAITDVWQYHEVWRFHPTGLFTHRWRVREDGTGYRGTIHLVATIYTIAEIFEFGRRLYRDDETIDEIMFRIQLTGVHGRLVSGKLPFGEHYSGQASRNQATHTVTLPRVDLIAGVLTASIDAAESLLGQLGLTTIPRAFIEGMARQFLAGQA